MDFGKPQVRQIVRTTPTWLPGSPDVMEEVSNSPWASVFRADHETGRVYIKEPAPAFSIEGRLTRFLGDELGCPVIGVLAVDTASGTFVSRDAGEPLRLAYGRLKDPRLPIAAITGYADTQVAAIAHAGVLLAMGLPDWRLPHLPGLFRDATADGSPLLDGLTPETRCRLPGTLDAVDAACETLDKFGLPATLDHGDLNDGNFLVGADGTVRSGDWGETVIGHPFLSVASFTSGFRRRYGNNPTGVQAATDMREAYLQKWSWIAPHGRLTSAMAVAEHLCLVRYALGFHRLVTSLPAQDTAHLQGHAAPALELWVSGQRG